MTGRRMAAPALDTGGSKARKTREESLIGHEKKPAAEKNEKTNCKHTD
jgi:hypothetical protein